MRILIDTNIFILLEDSTILNEGLAELDRIHRENDIQLLVHPRSREDLQRDQDKPRRARSLSVLTRYPLLDRPPDYTDTFSKDYDITASNDNDSVDNALLSAVFGHSVSYLITQDNRIHRKAKRLGVEERVLYIEDALEFLKGVYGRQPITIANIEEVFLHEILPSLGSPFFESLRGDYNAQKFNKWFRNNAESGRKAWISRDANSDVGAICIYKDEPPEPLTTDKRALSGSILKLCTLKVGEQTQGNKIGELFLKAAFQYAFINKKDHIYLTVYPHHERLVDLCKDFGFYEFGSNDNGELVLVKDHSKRPPISTLAPLDYHIAFSPHFKSGDSIGKFIVPIQPAFHNKLFPDYHDGETRQARLFSFGLNAIKLAYLCHSSIRQIKPGDILLFYRSHDIKGITSIGVVESAEHMKGVDSVLEVVSRRTVYNRKEIEYMASTSCLIILFRLSIHLNQPFLMTELQELGINGPIQTIRSIPTEVFQGIAERAGLQNSFYAD